MNIELSDFVNETLVQIIKGVKQAQEYSSKYEDGEINPVARTRDGLSQSGLSIHKVQFDIAITASQGEGAKAKIGVLSGIIGLGAEAEIKQSNITQNRIKFDVPITYPLKRFNKENSNPT